MPEETNIHLRVGEMKQLSEGPFLIIEIAPVTTEPPVWSLKVIPLFNIILFGW
jgi:hypothetical protein